MKNSYLDSHSLYHLLTTTNNSFLLKPLFFNVQIRFHTFSEILTHFLTLTNLLLKLLFHNNRKLSDTSLLIMSHHLFLTHSFSNLPFPKFLQRKTNLQHHQWVIKRVRIPELTTFHSQLSPEAISRNFSKSLFFNAQI